MQRVHPFAAGLGLSEIRLALSSNVPATREKQGRTFQVTNVEQRVARDLAFTHVSIVPGAGKVIARQRVGCTREYGKENRYSIHSGLHR